MQIKLYGADWCSMTTQTRRHLKSLGLEHEYIDVDQDPKASQWVRDHNDGLEKKPTLDIAGTILSEPSNSELDAVLRQKHMIQ